MTVQWREQMRPGVALRDIVSQATISLIAMDAERLEELARCCMELNRGCGNLPECEVAGFADGDDSHAGSGMVGIATPDANRAWPNASPAPREPGCLWEQMAADLALLDRVLFETRANLIVLSRLHAIRLREIDTLKTAPTPGSVQDRVRKVPGTEDGYGDN
jgi:hypothetical protein